jgi:DNA repair exonuclease SbcCD ATPase subunit
MKRPTEILAGITIAVLVGVIIYLFCVHEHSRSGKNTYTIVNNPSKKLIAEADSLQKALNISSSQIDNYEKQLKNLQKDSTNIRVKFSAIIDSLAKYRELSKKLSADIVALNEQFKKEIGSKDKTIQEQLERINQQDIIIAKKSADLQQATENANKQSMQMSVLFHDFNTYSNGYNDPDRDLKKSDKAHLIREIEFIYSFSRALTPDDVLSLVIEGVAEKKLSENMNRNQKNAKVRISVEKKTFEKKKYKVVIYLTNNKFGINQQEIGSYPLNFTR